MVRVLIPLSHSVCLSVTIRLATASAPLGPVPKPNRYDPLMSGTDGGGWGARFAAYYEELSGSPITGQLGRFLPGIQFSHCSFAYSTFACFRMGTSGSASFQSVRKS